MPRKPNEGKDGFIRYRASKHDCDVCPLKPQCCPKDNGRRLMHSVHEAARDLARDIRKSTSNSKGEFFITILRRADICSNPPRVWMIDGANEIQKIPDKTL